MPEMKDAPTGAGHYDLMAMASQHIPCNHAGAHPEHIYPGIPKSEVWYCDGTWPKGNWEKLGDSVKGLGHEYRRALEPSAQRVVDWILRRLR